VPSPVVSAASATGVPHRFNGKYILDESSRVKDDGLGGGDDPPSDDELKMSDVALSNKKINEAGEFLARGDQSLDNPVRQRMFIDVTKWRSGHELTLKQVSSILRGHVKQQPVAGIVVGRTKRMQSIISKLVRRPDLKLTAMQDVCGCRVILEDMYDVRDFVHHLKAGLADRLNSGSETKYDDYIEQPKQDGYRSVHCVVRFTIRNSDLRPRKIEIQVRSLLQHRWATAVETVDLFTGQTIKIGGGDQKWRRFFALTASLFATKENCPLVPNTPTSLDGLKREIGWLATELHVRHKLRTWSELMHSALNPKRELADSHVSRYLVELDTATKQTRVTVFPPSILKLAVERYRAVEQENEKFPNRSAVLVSAASITEVRQAYPGFYGDTKAFLEEIGLK